MKASRQAAAAVVAVLELKPDDRPIVVTVESNEIKLMDLQTCIENVKKLQIALKNLEFNKVLELRGKYANLIYLLFILNEFIWL